MRMCNVQEPFVAYPSDLVNNPDLDDAVPPYPRAHGERQLEEGELLCIYVHHDESWRSRQPANRGKVVSTAAIP